MVERGLHAEKEGVKEAGGGRGGQRAAQGLGPAKIIGRAEENVEQEIQGDEGREEPAPANGQQGVIKIQGTQ